MTGSGSPVSLESWLARQPREWLISQAREFGIQEPESFESHDLRRLIAAHDPARGGMMDQLPGQIKELGIDPRRPDQPYRTPPGERLLSEAGRVARRLRQPSRHEEHLPVIREALAEMKALITEIEEGLRDA